jgi:hypothetical protein
VPAGADARSVERAGGQVAVVNVPAAAPPPTDGLVGIAGADEVDTDPDNSVAPPERDG